MNGRSKTYMSKTDYINQVLRVIRYQGWGDSVSMTQKDSLLRLGWTGPRSWPRRESVHSNPGPATVHCEALLELDNLSVPHLENGDPKSASLGLHED